MCCQPTAKNNGISVRLTASDLWLWVALIIAVIALIFLLS